MKDIQDRLALQFGLTADERAQLLPSGRQTTFANRVGWAATYLRKAHVIESRGRGVVRTIARGEALLDESPSRVDMQFLKRYPEYLAFQAMIGPKPTVIGSEIAQGSTIVETPEEVLARSYGQLREALRDEILATIMSMSPTFFERLVVDLMLSLGYGGSLDSGQTLGKSVDEGVDGVIKEDKLGLDLIYLQAKRWEGTVGREVIQGFAGSLEGKRATKGVFITTSTFSSGARQYVEQIQKRIVLIDGPMLADLMIQSGLGVTTAASYDVKRMDSDYFSDS